MRLIDADKATEGYSAWLNNYINCGNDPFSDTAESVRYVMQQIDRQPTAYDVDAVVKELEEFKKTWHWECDCRKCNASTSCVSCLINRILEIVKRGGRNEV